MRPPSKCFAAVACGRAMAYFEFGPPLHRISAGLALVRAASATTLSIPEGKSRSEMACSRKVRPTFEACVAWPRNDHVNVYM